MDFWIEFMFAHWNFKFLSLSDEQETQKTGHEEEEEEVEEEEEEEEEEKDSAWMVFLSSSTAEDPPLFSFWSLFLNYGVRILYLFIFPIPDAVCFGGVVLSVYKRRRRRRRRRRDVVYYKRSAMVFPYTAVVNAHTSKTLFFRSFESCFFD